ncbi:hypothetical protein JAB5_50270 [Janthinobacterium sp. HH103]|uniref:hypothetical protein n=1 Tax=unclassified Janthinobacterium TaxID=2610881 RepID=UPI000893EA4E|nr:MULTISPECIES: hypothetical protein [unclassified Janthinobacterium]OEZ68277.1 hypothetical protein JAB5_50270 [Janthinobacterium sp. HH103]QOU75526.1 hypothetical protein JAB4_050110 [Janthinobacterium sp. HH102]
MIEFLSVVKSVVGLFYSIPPVIWSGVIGSMLALSGVYLTSKHSYKNLKMQLEHDSIEKSTERSLKLRQDSYMLVAKELVSAEQHLANIPMLDILKENPAKGTNAFFAAAAQCQLVASPRTAKLLMIFANKFSMLSIRAISSVHHIFNAEVAAELAKDSIDRNKIEFDRTLLKMTELNQEIGSEKANYDVLKSYLDFYKEEMSKGWDQRGVALNEKQEHTLNYSRSLVDDLIALTSEQIEVLVSMRADLGFDSDIEEYRKTLFEQHQSILKEMEHALAKTN